MQRSGSGRAGIQGAHCRVAARLGHAGLGDQRGFLLGREIGVVGMVEHRLLHGGQGHRGRRGKCRHGRRWRLWQAGAGELDDFLHLLRLGIHLLATELVVGQLHTVYGLSRRDRGGQRGTKHQQRGNRVFHGAGVKT